MNPAEIRRDRRPNRSGNEARRRATLLFGALLALVVGCTPAEVPAPLEPEPVLLLTGPPIREGAYTRDDAESSSRLLMESEELLAGGEVEEALARAAQVESMYPQSPGSSLALWIRARALAELEIWADAESAAESFAELVVDDPTAVGQAYLLRAQVRRQGNLPGAIEAVFEIPLSSGEAELLAADALAEAWASGFATPELRDLIDEAPRHPRLLPVFLAELAVRRYLNGDLAEASALAEEALGFAPGAAVVAQAQAVLDGEIVGRLEVSANIGGLLPVDGSPSISRLAQEIREGIEVALAIDEGEFSRPIRFLPIEDAVDPARAADAVVGFEEEGLAGLLGPLQEASLEAAARARRGLLPILSPTARLLPQGVEGVYSLNGIDPAAGEALAALVLSREIREVVAIHPSSSEMEEEFRWFREAFARGGGTITRVLNYPPGSTGFRDQMAEIVRLNPRALVLILPPEDVELLAPQIAFYGVDDLADLMLFGNPSWTSERILQSVQARSTEGVFAVTSWVGQGEFGPGWDGFVEAYEQHFQRSLRSPTPALGFDAARLLLRSAREGGGTPEGTLAALERIQGFPGATGFLSVVNGRVQRSFVPVRVENRRLVLLTP